MSTEDGGVAFQDGQSVDSDGPFIVVGANGFLGSEVCLHLRRRNRWAKIVAPLRSTSSTVNPRLEGVNVEWVSCGSVVDREVMQRCLDAASAQNHDNGVQRKHVAGIFYTAGLTIYSTHEEDIAAMHDANVRLPDMVLQFCTDFNLRTVFFSCSHVVGCQFRDQSDWIAHDDTERCHASIDAFPFLQQRRDVELHWHQEALKGRAPIVFLRPSLLLGPGDERVRSTYALLELISGMGPVALRYGGGISFVDVRDVASAALQCMFGNVRGGTLMNLNAANLPCEDFVELVEKTLRLSCTSWIPYRSTPRIPAVILRAAAHGITRMRAIFRLPYDERYSPTYIESKLRFYNVSCQRAKGVIRWDPRDLEETIQDTARHLVRLLQHNEAAAAPNGPTTTNHGEIRVVHRPSTTTSRGRSSIVGFGAATSIASSSWRKSRAAPKQSGGPDAGSHRMRLRRLLAAMTLIALVIAGVVMVSVGG
ncbi:epimerase, putative [Bodo saltans]|uniref:Epimerase, putative n=1 Tax=Bodo saltans TaxID=75058 RepID=A0A0S4J9N5_BODSA|nr:epimerase, putative [Bodo saltans]|eukprot:CUG86841.1 epimerase, putative [Bodo saltans]